MPDSLEALADSTHAPRRRKAMDDAAALVPDRLPPHSREAECGVLGCILLDPSQCLGECVNLLKSGAETFYDLKHGIIYTALNQMSDTGQAIDLITLQQHLKDAGLLERVGGIAYLMSLADAVPSAANLRYYLDIVIDKHILRKVIRVAEAMRQRAAGEEGEVDALLDCIERDVLAIRNERGRQGQARNLADGLVDAITTIEGWWKAGGGISGLSTGFPDLDKMTGGLKPKDMIVIAARPSMGKSSLAMNIAEHVAMSLGLPVGVFSLEMSYESLVLRTMSSQAKVNLRNAQEGMLVERDFTRLTTAAGKLRKSSIIIDDEAGITVQQLRSRARKMVSVSGVKLFVIDYLQLIAPDHDSRHKTPEQQIGEISTGIKTMAKELNVPVLVLAQLNREVEKRAGAKPKLSDLRSSGQIEQDADVIGFLCNTQTNDADDDFEDRSAIPVGLLIEKQRNGPTGPVHLVFLKQFTRFESASRIDQSDLP